MASLVANNWKELLLIGTPVIGDAYTIILMEPGFSFSRAAHEEYADVIASELPTAFGYTAGGEVLAGIAVINDAILSAGVMTWNNEAWPIAAGDLQASGAIIFDDTIAAPDVDPIVGYIDFGGTITTYDGGTFTIANITFLIQ